MMKLFPFQREGVLRMRKLGGRVLLADSMGLGKTIQALVYIRASKSHLPAIVVCPASVKWVWEQEARRLGLSSDVLNGQTPHKIDKAVNVIIINYDVLHWWLPTLRLIGARTVVIDECHYVKSRSAKRTKVVKLLCKGVPHVLALSGTPMTNRPAELWPTLNLLRPDLYPAFWPFAQAYCGLSHNHFGWDWSGATNVDRLNAQLTKHVMIRRRKEDVLPELPAKLRTMIPCELSNRSEYKGAVDDFESWMTENFSSTKQQVPAMVQLGYLLRLVSELKAASVSQWIDDHLAGNGEKLVVFAKHHKMIDSILANSRYESVCIDGNTPVGDREAAVDWFQRGPVRLFVGNIQAAGIGITLTAASTVAFAELDWVPANMTQAEDRCHRIGQRQPVWIYYLVARDTVEQLMCRALMNKQKVVDDVIDGVETVDRFNVFDAVIGGFQWKTKKKAAR